MSHLVATNMLRMTGTSMCEGSDLSPDMSMYKQSIHWQRYTKRSDTHTHYPYCGKKIEIEKSIIWVPSIFSKCFRTYAFVPLCLFLFICLSGFPFHLQGLGQSTDPRFCKKQDIYATFTRALTLWTSPDPSELHARMQTSEITQILSCEPPSTESCFCCCIAILSFRKPEL